MTKEQKVAAIDAIVERLEETPSVYLTDYSGLSVDQLNDLRGRLREGDVSYTVLKNTLVRIAMERIGGYEELFEGLHGPTAVAFTNDPSTPAKVIKAFLKDNEELEKPGFKGAYIDGAVFGSDQLDVLATMKSKDELIGDIIGLLMAPATNIIGALQAQGSNIVGALKTIAEQGEA